MRKRRVFTGVAVAGLAGSAAFAAANPEAVKLTWSYVAGGDNEISIPDVPDCVHTAETVAAAALDTTTTIELTEVAPASPAAQPQEERAEPAETPPASQQPAVTTAATTSSPETTIVKTDQPQSAPPITGYSSSRDADASEVNVKTIYSQYYDFFDGDPTRVVDDETGVYYLFFTYGEKDQLDKVDHENVIDALQATITSDESFDDPEMEAGRLCIQDYFLATETDPVQHAAGKEIPVVIVSQPAYVSNGQVMFSGEAKGNHSYAYAWPDVPVRIVPDIDVSVDIPTEVNLPDALSLPDEVGVNLPDEVGIPGVPDEVEIGLDTSGVDVTPYNEFFLLTSGTVNGNAPQNRLYDYLSHEGAHKWREWAEEDNYPYLVDPEEAWAYEMERLVATSRPEFTGTLFTYSED